MPACPAIGHGAFVDVFGGYQLLQVMIRVLYGFMDAFEQQSRHFLILNIKPRDIRVQIRVIGRVDDGNIVGNTQAASLENILRVFEEKFTEEEYGRRRLREIEKILQRVLRSVEAVVARRVFFDVAPIGINVVTNAVFEKRVDKERLELLKRSRHGRGRQHHGNAAVAMLQE